MNGLHVAATGRVSFEPEMRYSGTGKAMLVFNMSVDQSFTATESRPAPEPIYLKVTAWEELAAELADTLKKGDGVYLEGKLTHRQWETREGEPRCTLSVSAWTVDVHAKLGRSTPKREREPAEAAGRW